MGNNFCNCKNRDNAKTEDNNVERKEGYNISTFDSNMNTAKYNNTFNTDDNTTRDNSFIKAKGGAAQQFQNKSNMLLLVKLQRSVKKFLQNSSRNKYKRNHFANYGSKNNQEGNTGVGANQKGLNNLHSYFTKGSNMATLPDFDENAPKRIACEIFDSGIKYLGELVGKCKNGFGIQFWKDGATYTGHWKNHKADGIGVFKHSDGDQYLGCFVADRASGFGIYKHANGASYLGMWKDDFQNGLGFENWSDESVYEGEYIKGKKQGLGRYSWCDGSNYEGEWQENTLNGWGIYNFKDGRKYAGQWRLNTMHGYGEYSWNDGRRYVGFYNMDKKDGFGIYIWNEGRAYIGYWKDGKQHGVGKYVNNGVTRFGNWQKGKRMSWYEDEKEAISSIPHGNNDNFSKLFMYELKDILTFISD